MSKQSVIKDEELLKRFINGDGDAFTELYERYKGLLLKIIFSMVQNEAAAEELCQDCFLSLIKEPEKYDPERGATFKTFLCSIAINKSLHRVQQETGRSTKRKYVDIVDMEILSTKKSPLTEIEDEEVSKELHKALDALSSEQRMAILLHYHEDLSYEEIAQLSDTKMTTIRMRIHHAKQTLKERLGKFLKIEITKPSK